MNVASLELCKELYGLSGWGAHSSLSITTFDWHEVTFGTGKHTGEGEETAERYEYVTTLEADVRGKYAVYMYECPAYDLGFLLRKLAEFETVDIQFNHPDHRTALMLDRWIGKYVAYTPWLRQGEYPIADTPEDAACKLAIELFKQNILTKGEA